MEKTEAGYLMTRIVLRPKVVVLDASQVERARRILEKAEKNCLISNSMKARIEMESDVTVA
jgi:organic hydroperoxide reductase OsmC/OhrA